MKVFVWNYVNGLTINYHDGGGAMVIAEDLETARSLWLSEVPDVHKESLQECELLKKDPDFVCGCDTQESQVFEFPDAGCC